MHWIYDSYIPSQRYNGPMRFSRKHVILFTQVFTIEWTIEILYDFRPFQLFKMFAAN